MFILNYSDSDYNFKLLCVFFLFRRIFLNGKIALKLSSGTLKSGALLFSVQSSQKITNMKELK